MNFEVHPIIMCVISSFLGGGVGATVVRLFMQNEAKKALAPDIEAIKNKIKSVEDEYVTCRECTANHNSVNNTLAELNRKLDLILQTILKRS